MRFWLVLVCLLTLALPFAAPAAVEWRAPSTVAADDSGPKELEAFQGYLDPAPLGMDVRYAWTLPGGRGENVRVADIEYNWNVRHNDLLAATSNLFIYVRGIDTLSDSTLNQANIDHGTAVLGILVATANNVGVTGICHRASMGLINPLTSGSTADVAGAIRRAASRMDAGDVLLLEQQSVGGPRFNPSNGHGLLPIEFEPEVFAAIKEATSKGVIVVESAGNGFESLDDPAYNGIFDRSKRDSGAILVGAALPEGGVYGPGPDRTRTEESNYGSRVDLQGWGRFVTTTGYGVLRREQGENNWYTIDFGATSAASAMVAGAAAVLESIVKQRGRAPLTPAELRRLLVSTGSPQTGDLKEHVGPRPDLRAAISAIDSPAGAIDPLVSSVKFKKSNGKLTVDGENFLAGDSVIEIDGRAVTRLKYPSGSQLPNGTTTRIMTKSDVSEMIPPGTEVRITVYTPSSGKRSEPFPFRRD